MSDDDEHVGHPEGQYIPTCRHYHIHHIFRKVVYEKPENQNVSMRMDRETRNIPQPIGHGGNQLEIQYNHIEVLHQHHEQQLDRRKYLKREISSLLTSRIAIDIPTRSDGSGLISKISMPCIFPRISRRSRPVACSKSVGIVPGAAPGGSRSSSVLISVVSLVFLLPTYNPAIAGSMSMRTFE